MDRRGRRWVLGVVLFVAAAGDRVGATEAALPASVVCWPMESTPAMVAEVERLIGRAFVLEHRVRSVVRGCEPDAVWISFTLRPGHVRSTVLALADPARRLIAVYRDAVAAFIGEHPGTVVYHRALGRVAAHEIVHVVAGTGHEGHGLMRPRFSKEMLTGVRPLPLSDGPLRANRRPDAGHLHDPVPEPLAVVPESD